MLFEAGIIPALSHWLKSKQTAILVPVLGCLSALVYGNEVIANKLLECKFRLPVFYYATNYFLSYSMIY